MIKRASTPSAPCPWTLCKPPIPAFGWARYVGTTGHCIAMRSFGASAPLRDLQKQFMFTVAQVVEVARQQLRRRR
ncbi:MAG: transketolase-like TK C-terminal-containing protein [Nitrospiraceae bacterium]